MQDPFSVDECEQSDLEVCYDQPVAALFNERTDAAPPDRCKSTEYIINREVGVP